MARRRGKWATERREGERDSERWCKNVKKKQTRDTKTSSSEHWNKVDFVSSSYSPSSSSSSTSSSLSVQSARGGEKSCNSNDRETIIRRPNELLAWFIPHQFNPKRNRLLVGFIHRTKEREKRKRERDKQKWFELVGNDTSSIIHRQREKFIHSYACK